MYRHEAETQYYVVTWDKKPFKLGRVYFGSRRVIFAMAKVAADCIFECCESHVREAFDRAFQDEEEHYADYEDKWHGIAIMKRPKSHPAHSVMISKMRKIAADNSFDIWYNVSARPNNMFVLPTRGLARGASLEN
jgi:hypothetical protein